MKSHIVKVPYYTYYKDEQDAPVCKGVLNVPVHVVQLFRDRGYLELAELPRLADMRPPYDEIEEGPVSHIKYTYQIQDAYQRPYLMFYSPGALRVFVDYLKRETPKRKKRRKKDKGRFSFSPPSMIR